MYVLVIDGSDDFCCASGQHQMIPLEDFEVTEWPYECQALNCKELIACTLAIWNIADDGDWELVYSRICTDHMAILRSA